MLKKYRFFHRFMLSIASLVTNTFAKIIITRIERILFRKIITHEKRKYFLIEHVCTATGERVS